jgi:site-specific DNA recombinase
MEGVLAAFAQFDNDVRSDRTRAGMKAALELGRWVFLAPIGYLNAPRSIGKSLIHDPERAPLVRRAFDDYASGRFTKEQLLKHVRRWDLTNRRGKPLTSQAIGMLLRNQLYAGIVDVPEYGVRNKRGDFEPLISEELFYRIQAILSGRVPNTALRMRAHPDFPLRGFVRCESCGRGLTGSWSKFSPFEVTPGECPAGARFQVALETDRSRLVRELDSNVKTPGPSGCGVRALAGIVARQPGLHIGRQPDIEVWIVIAILQNVDESLVGWHAPSEASQIPRAECSIVGGSSDMTVGDGSF